MALNFVNAELLSYSHNSDFFGDGVLRYRATKQYAIRGRLLDLTNDQGVSGIISGEKALTSSATDWQVFNVNGIVFGSGVINDITYEYGNDVRIKLYNISFTVNETGNAANLYSGSYYSGVNYSDYSSVQGLTETLTFENDFENKNYRHDINVQALTSNTSGSIRIAKNIAENLFNATNLTGFISDYNTLGAKRFYYTEKYDELTAQCSFTRRLQNLGGTGCYSINKKYRFDRNENGVTAVSEIGKIKAICEPYINILTDAFNTERLNSYAGCLDVFGAYKESNDYNLDATPYTEGTSINTQQGTLEYELKYSNDLEFNADYYWKYSHEISRQEGNLIDSHEKGTFIGRGIRGINKYNKALNGYNTEKANISTRTKAVYDGVKVNFSLVDGNQFIFTHKTEDFNKYLGLIQYDYGYTNDLTFSSVGIFNKTDVVVEESFAVPISRAYNVFNYREIAQTSCNFEVAHKTVNISLRGKRNTSMQDYVTQGKVLAAPYSGDFVQDVNYSLNPNQNEFEMNVTWAKLYNGNS